MYIHLNDTETINITIKMKKQSESIYCRLIRMNIRTCTLCNSFALISLINKSKNPKHLMSARA